MINIFKHFKGGIYIVIGESKPISPNILDTFSISDTIIVKGCLTNEDITMNLYISDNNILHSSKICDTPLIIYKDCRLNNNIYARPKHIFFGEVDNNKYPNTKQLSRFELCGSIYSDIQPPIKSEICSKCEYAYINKGKHIYCNKYYDYVVNLNVPCDNIKDYIKNRLTEIENNQLNNKTNEQSINIRQVTNKIDRSDNTKDTKTINSNDNTKRLSEQQLNSIVNRVNAAVKDVSTN